MMLVVPALAQGQTGIELETLNSESAFVESDTSVHAFPLPFQMNPILDSYLQEDRILPGYKEPGTALLFGFLITGGGHFYSGETKKGLILLGSAVGVLVVGAALSTQSCTQFVFTTYCEANYTPLYIGALLATGAWVYGIIDADNAAMRANARNGLTLNVRPVPVRTPDTGSARPGLSLQMSW